MTLLCSPNALKGSLSAVEAARIMREAIDRATPGATVLSAPIADGGNGTLDCLASAFNARVRTTSARGPLGPHRIQARWGMVQETKTAIIEMAEASGLHLVADSERDAMHASTYGTGELILEALNEGCTRIILGLGGSATNDGGAGCMRALGVRFLGADGCELADGGAALTRLETIDISGMDPRCASCEFTVLSDVRNPLCGSHGASVVFGPQKGADEMQVRLLDQALCHYAETIRRNLGRDVADIPGAGAAGGFGAGLLAFVPTQFVSGIDFIMDAVRIDALLEKCDAVLTSEGMIDAQTASGKAIAGLCRHARQYKKPVHAFVGRIEGDTQHIMHELGLASITEISPRSMPREEAMSRAAELMADAIAAFMADMR